MSWETAGISVKNSKIYLNAAKTIYIDHLGNDIRLTDITSGTHPMADFLTIQMTKENFDKIQSIGMSLLA